LSIEILKILKLAEDDNSDRNSKTLYRVSQEERSIFWDFIVSVILSKIVYMYMCPIPNGFRGGDSSLYSCRIIDKRKILRTVSHTGIYCSSDKIGTGCLVQHIFENSTVNISELCNSCEDMACCSSEFILTFLYADNNIHYVIGQFVSCVHFPSVRFILHPTP
jgi:hypothetical protein